MIFDYDPREKCPKDKSIIYYKNIIESQGGGICRFNPCIKSIDFINQENVLAIGDDQGIVRTFDVEKSFLMRKIELEYYTTNIISRPPIYHVKDVPGPSNQNLLMLASENIIQFHDLRKKNSKILE